MQSTYVLASLVFDLLPLCGLTYLAFVLRRRRSSAQLTAIGQSFVEHQKGKLMSALFACLVVALVLKASAALLYLGDVQVLHLIETLQISSDALLLISIVGIVARFVGVVKSAGADA